MEPLVSVIVTSYNRKNTVLRTVQSILNQTWKNLEIVLVDDGSTDGTLDVLATIKDERVRIIKHPVNRGVTAAKNTGLNNLRGEWFTSVDSDDEIVPNAIETLMKIPLEVDPEVTAIDSGALDTVANKLSDATMTEDQYVDEAMIIRSANEGDVWGITKTTLLGTDRLNENLPGWEDTLWYKINTRAKRYYIHKQLHIYHTEGNDRVSNKKFDITGKSKTFKELLNEEYYLEKVKKYNTTRFAKYCIKGFLYLSAIGDRKTARKWATMLKDSNIIYFSGLQLAGILPGSFIKFFCKLTKV